MAIPPYVATGQPVASAWGNQVVDTLTDITSRLDLNIHGGIAAATTDSNGYLTIFYGTTFPGPPVVLLTEIADTSGGSPHILVIHGPTGTTSVNVRVYRYDGVPWASAPVTISWLVFLGYFY